MQRPRPPGAVAAFASCIVVYLTECNQDTHIMIPTYSSACTLVFLVIFEFILVGASKKVQHHAALAGRHHHHQQRSALELTRDGPGMRLGYHRTNVRGEKVDYAARFHWL